MSHAFCKLLVAIGDHSTSYLATNLSSPKLVSVLGAAPAPTRAQLIQNFLKLLLAYTGLPGFYGVNEDESEMTLGFWYLFQEALWSTPSDEDTWEEEAGTRFDVMGEKEKEHWIVVKAVYSELVMTLRRKVVWPGRDYLSGWTSGELLLLRHS